MGQHHDSRQDAGSVYQQKATRQRMASEMRVKLRNYSFTHLITLATNNQDYSLRRMRSVLQTWDARINRWLVGPKWHQRPDERLLWFAFLEKLEANPHWHLLAEIDPQLMLRATSQERCRQLEERGRRYWKSIVPGGTFDCRPIENDRVILDLSRFCAAPSARLSHLPFESDGAFPAQC